MQLPTDRKYLTTHEWAVVQDDVVLVGITDFAQDQLGDLVFVGDFTIQVHLEVGAVAGVVESVKAASDIYMPVTGTVVEYNERLDEAPELLNESPFETWIFKIKPDNMADLDGMLTAEQYRSENV